MAFSIRQRQHDAVVHMLNLHVGRMGASALDENAPNEVYKVLIMDRRCFEIITPLVKVHELRRHGVTLHLLLENDRQPIGDVPAVYFVSPTAENVKRIAGDLSAGLYDAHYLNFSSSLPRALLEELAVKATECGAAAKVTRVFDQYLDFVSLAPDLFSLGRGAAYVTLNDPGSSDAAVEAEIERIVDGLLAACATLGKVPVIRCPKGGAAEMIARSLEKRLRDHARGKGGLFATDVGGPHDVERKRDGTNERPILCLFDRNFDVPSIVKHAWTYEPLVHDVLAMRLNRVDIKGDARASDIGKKSYDLEAADDAFWSANADAQFPVVAEEVEKALGEYKKAMADITSATAGDKNAGGAGGSGAPSVGDDRNDTSALVSAVASLPQLQERKRVIDKHTNIATALLGEIKTRGLDEYHVVEEDLLAGKGDRAAMMGLLDATGRGSPEDKLRLAIVRAAAAARQRARAGPADAEDAAASASDAEAVEGALRASGADSAALEFFQRAARLDASLGGGAGPGAYAQTVTATADDDSGGGDLLDWADKLYGQSIDAVAKGVQSLLRGDRRGAVARAVEAWRRTRAASRRLIRSRASTRRRRSRSGARAAVASPARRHGGVPEAIVFVAGGGNYAEYREYVALGKAAKARADRRAERTRQKRAWCTAPPSRDRRGVRGAARGARAEDQAVREARTKSCVWERESGSDRRLRVIHPRINHRLCRPV